MVTFYPPNSSDLFDDEGFSLSDINKTLIGDETIQQQEDVYFLDGSDDDSADIKPKKQDKDGRGEKLSLEEEVDLQRARVRDGETKEWILGEEREREKERERERERER